MTRTRIILFDLALLAWILACVVLYLMSLPR